MKLDAEEIKIIEQHRAEKARLRANALEQFEYYLDAELIGLVRLFEYASSVQIIVHSKHGKTFEDIADATEIEFESVEQMDENKVNWKAGKFGKTELIVFEE